MSAHAAPEPVVVSMIVFNAIIAVCSEVDPAYERVWLVAEAACLIFFGIEMATKMRKQRREFWRSKWNLFDLTVIVVAALPMLLFGMDLGILRVARVARLFHLGRHISGLRLVPQAVRLAALARWRMKFGRTAELRISLG